MPEKKSPDAKRQQSVDSKRDERGELQSLALGHAGAQQDQRGDETAWQEHVHSGVFVTGLADDYKRAEDQSETSRLPQHKQQPVDGGGAAD